MIQLNSEIFSWVKPVNRTSAFIFDLLFHIEILIGLKSLPCDNQATNGRDINCLSPGKVSVKIVSADNEILYLPHMK